MSLYDRITAGPVIAVEKAIPNPSDEQINELHEQVMDMVKLMYEENRPVWEKSDLVIH
jgi:hypothetical protein